MKINVVNFKISLGFVAFTFEADGQPGSAELQLPDTGDSMHMINNEDYDIFNESHSVIYDTLSDFYYDFMADPELAAASALIGDCITSIQQVGRFYVAFTSKDDATLIKESPYKSYNNNISLFELVTPSDLEIGEGKVLDEHQLIQQALDLRNDK